MSADPEVELVRSLVDSFSADMAPEDFAAAFHPGHAEIVPLRADLEGITYRGADAPQQFLAASRDSWERLRFDTVEVRRIGGVIYVRARLHARSREAGLDIERDLGAVVRLRDGRIVHMHTYGDPGDALAAAEAAG